MAPLSFAVSRKVNPEGAEPLTAAQAWRGLQIKARNPTGFLPNVTMCEITEDHGRKFTRKVALMGMPPMLEDITEHEGAIIFFETPGTERSVTNILSCNENNELIMTFCFAGGVPMVTGDPSPEELNKNVGQAVEKTLLKIRELVKEGSI